MSLLGAARPTSTCGQLLLELEEPSLLVLRFLLCSERRFVCLWGLLEVLFDDLSVFVCRLQPAVKNWRLNLSVQSDVCNFLVVRDSMAGSLLQVVCDV